MLRIEAAALAVKRVLSTIPGAVHKRSACDAASVPLLPALPNALRLGAFRQVGRAKLGMNQPEGLAKEGEQQHPRENLRAAEAFAREIEAHKVEPSVLPWRRPFAGKVLR